MTTHSDPTPALFVWIPKVAGTSIWAALRSTGQACQDRHDDVGQVTEAATFTTFGHCSLPALVDAGVITHGFLRRRFTFAFVRNPWDRIVSLFHYLRQPGGGATFAQFVEAVTDRVLPPVGPYNVRGLSQANPQLDWLRPAKHVARTQPAGPLNASGPSDPLNASGAGGDFITDFIGRYERLRQDWRLVCRAVGIQAELPHLNRSRRRHYRHYYDARLRKKVARRSAEEIDVFRYTF